MATLTLPPLAVLLLLLTQTNASKEPKIQSFELHPTSSLLTPNGRHLNEENLVVSGIYGPIQPIHPSLRKKEQNEVKRHNALVEDFNRHRHLSRFEREYRLENGLDLEIGWDGIYRFEEEERSLADGHEEEGEDPAEETNGDASRRRDETKAVKKAPPVWGTGGHHDEKKEETPIAEKKDETKPEEIRDDAGDAKDGTANVEAPATVEVDTPSDDKGSDEEGKAKDDRDDAGDANAADDGDIEVTESDRDDADDKKGSTAQEEEKKETGSDTKDEAPRDDAKEEDSKAHLAAGGQHDDDDKNKKPLPPPQELTSKEDKENMEKLLQKGKDMKEVFKEIETQEMVDSVVVDAARPEQGDEMLIPPPVLGSEVNDMDVASHQPPAHEVTQVPAEGMLGATVHNGGLLNSYQTAPLSQGYGTHYATVWVGTPTPQRKSVIVDTGSHFTAFPCKGCQNCGEEHHTDLYFDPDKSSSFRALGCGECQGARCSKGKCVFSQSYTEGSSWQAYQAVDHFFCGGNDMLAAANPIDQEFAIDFMFGCQTSETGLFVTQLADGIMGMSAHEATLPKQMYNKGKLEHNMFSLCFRRAPNVSKQGVTAGIMTLGGIDTRLDSSPMVFAKNVAGSGWYTVYVRNIFLRTNGGQSAQADDPNNQIVTKMPVDLNSVNSGKGVIVDSGTTDTYLHKNLAKHFGEIWLRLVGKPYSNTATRITKDVLMKLPTILVQVTAFDTTADPSLGSPDNVAGLVGETLDPKNPNDILLAIPATHYMEYSPNTQEYTSRLYFTESRGGVLGANAMMGHDVLFDWENQRIGFAESNCEYEPSSEAGGGAVEGDEVDEGGVAIDCALGTPSLSESCMESVDLSLCGNNPSLTLQGTEKWTMVVENAGTIKGKSCSEVAMMRHPDSTGAEPPTLSCDGNGLCTEIRPCDMTCANAQAGAGNIVPVPVDHQGESGTPAGGESGSGEGGDAAGIIKHPCGDNLWGACEYSCTQSKINSMLMSDGLCHEEKRDVRPCHIDACGRSDPCRVPFVVHAILVFIGADAGLWQKMAEEFFAVALKDTINGNKINPEDELFGAGDVNVLMAVPWYGRDEMVATNNPDLEGSEDKVMGMKVVVEISIFNPNAILPEASRNVVDDHDRRRESEDVEQTSSDSSSSGGKLDGFVLKVKKSLSRLSPPPRSTCEESDLYPLARTALDVHKELSRDGLMPILLQEMQKWDLAARDNAPAHLPPSPFKSMYGDLHLARDSGVLTSWTIRTEINDVHDHNTDGTMRSSIMYYATNVPFMFVFLGILVCVCSCGMCCGRTFCVPSIAKHQAALLAQMKDRTERGRYAKVGTSPEDVLDSSNYDDDEGDIDFVSR